MIFIGILNGLLLLHFFGNSTSFPKFLPKINKIMEKDVFIENLEYPSCTSCKFYEPTNDKYEDKFSRCNKFGKKDIITDDISYSFVDSTRNDNNKCGLEGKYFEEEKYIKLKIFKHKLINNFPYIAILLTFLFNIILQKL